MREPRFWARDVDPKSREAAPLMRFLLTPLSWIYASSTARRISKTDPTEVPATVICVGNLTAGGVGKSPVVATLRQRIAANYNLRVASLSRGYKGKLKGPLKVDPAAHSAQDVGDEPLMLSQRGEAWIGADRAAAGQAMADDGVEVILMDDGHQNPGLKKDVSIIVVDAVMGFGNGYVIPKGPLREPVDAGLARADAVIVLGEGNAPKMIFESGHPVLHGKISPSSRPDDQPYVAFAGIGRPEKFFDTLTELGLDVRDAVPFPDHHAFSDADLNYLKQLAQDREATLITTEKDYVRLPADLRETVAVLPIEIQFDQPETLDKLIADVIKPARMANSEQQYIRPKDIDNRSTFRQRLMWRIEALAWDVIYWAPMKALGPDRASNFVGWLMKKIAPLLSQNKTVFRNLKLAFPNKSDAEIERIAQASWESVGRTAGELPHLPKIHPYDGDRVEVEGVEHLDALEASEQGAVFVSGHFANWEVMAAVICNRPVDCLITYRALNNPHIDRKLNKVRHDYGIGVLTPKGLGTREIMRALGQKRCVALMNDQKFNQGLAIEFFGHQAMTAPGPSRLALKYKVPIALVTTRRTGPARFKVIVHPPFVPEQTGDLEKDLQSCVERITALLETEVRANPEQWFWQHRRWPKEAWRDAGLM